MPRTDAQRRYDSENLKTVSISLNKKTETDLIEQLSKVPSKASYIKRLIREDILKESQG